MVGLLGQSAGLSKVGVGGGGGSEGDGREGLHAGADCLKLICQSECGERPFFNGVEAVLFTKSFDQTGPVLTQHNSV